MREEAEVAALEELVDALVGLGVLHEFGREPLVQRAEPRVGHPREEVMLGVVVEAVHAERPRLPGLARDRPQHVVTIGRSVLAERSRRLDELRDRTQGQHVEADVEREPDRPSEDHEVERDDGELHQREAGEISQRRTLLLRTRPDASSPDRRFFVSSCFAAASPDAIRTSRPTSSKRVRGNRP